MKTSYLSYLIELLQADEWHGAGENVEIAKGKHKLPVNWKEYIKLQWRLLK